MRKGCLCCLRSNKDCLLSNKDISYIYYYYFSWFICIRTRVCVCVCTFVSHSMISSILK